MAQTYSLDEFEQINPSYKVKGRWTEVARGRVEALHLLPPTEGLDPRSWLLIDFRMISSLPVAYIERFAGAAGERRCLQSPYLEGLSQAFGRFFMRVALPMDLPKDFWK